MHEIYGKRAKPEKQKERIMASNMLEENKKLIVTYLTQWAIEDDITDWRVDKIGRLLLKVGPLFKKSLKEVTREDLANVFAIINSWEIKKSTKIDYKKSIRQIIRWLNDGVSPAYFKNFRFAMKQQDNRLVDQIFTREEILRGIQAAKNIRDQALIATLYESGGRIGEVLSMDIKDFEQEKHYATVKLKGKTGERVNPIVNSVPLIIKYLEQHPDRENPDAPLWIIQEDSRYGKPLGYQGCGKMLKITFKRAGVKKKVHPHLFRHSRATELARDLTEMQMCKFFGWVPGSGQTRTYVHLSGRDINSAVLKLSGIKIEEEEIDENPLQPKKCPRCGLINGAEMTYCGRCRAALEFKTAIEVEKAVKEETDKAFQYLMEISSNPKMMEEFLRFKNKMSQ
ncbi:tyrosine-type recombinase/integrase [Candidatus Woesearchaeota archaeon]|nr:tyrosine-type recombinase/integrase [Candidatus Woesearchaeota archaeon]